MQSLWKQLRCDSMWMFVCLLSYFVGRNTTPEVIMKLWYTLSFYPPSTSPSTTTSSAPSSEPPCVSRPASLQGSSQCLPAQGLCSQGLTRWWLWTVRLNNWATGARVCSLTSVTVTPQTSLRAYRTDWWLKSASQVGAIWSFFKMVKDKIGLIYSHTPGWFFIKWFFFN